MLKFDKDKEFNMHLTKSAYIGAVQFAQSSPRLRNAGEKKRLKRIKINRQEPFILVQVDLYPARGLTPTLFMYRIYYFTFQPWHGIHIGVKYSAIEIGKG